MRAGIALTAGLIIASPSAARTIAVAPGADAQERLQTALIEAQPGDIVQIGAGRFDLTDGLSLDIEHVTVRGAGADKTILSFKGQMAAGEGLLVTSDDVVLRDFAVEDTRGDGIKSKGADRIVYKNIRVEWTGGAKETNGAYGVYPVESHDVLIDGVTVRGASDAGIYVGQSENIIVRGSVAEYNVAGIEIENSRRADVYGNTARHNAGGILVFDLPNLPIIGGGQVRVFANMVTDNDTPNFAPKANIVASVPTGTGVLVMANRQVELFNNVLGNNGTANVMITSYRLAFTDQRYDPSPRAVKLWNNVQGKAGFAPGFPGGKEIAAAMGGSLPPVVWDGAGDATELAVLDKVPVISLGVALGAPLASAHPAPIDLPQAKRMGELPAIMLHSAMEDAAR